MALDFSSCEPVVATEVDLQSLASRVIYILYTILGDREMHCYCKTTNSIVIGEFLFEMMIADTI